MYLLLFYSIVFRTCPRFCLFTFISSLLSSCSFFFFFSSRRRHTICLSDWSSDVCSSDLERELRDTSRRISSIGLLYRKKKPGREPGCDVTRVLLGVLLGFLRRFGALRLGGLGLLRRLGRLGLLAVLLRFRLRFGLRFGLRLGLGGLVVGARRVPGRDQCT